MLYNKDSKRYTEMCQIFDREFYEPNRDDEKLFKYMYLTFFMLASKSNFFQRYEDYDKYAQYAAQVVYTRFMRKWQNGERVKSMLNYAKGSMRPLRIMYQNQEFEQIFGGPTMDMSSATEDLRNSVPTEFSGALEDEVADELMSISETVERVVSSVPGTHSGSEDHRLYVSVMLSLLNASTLSKSQLATLEEEAKARAKAMRRTRKRGPVVSSVQRFLTENREEPMVLWGLDSTKEPLVRLLTNRVRMVLSDSIKEAIQGNRLPDDVVDSILYSAYQERCSMQDDQEGDAYA